MIKASVFRLDQWVKVALFNFIVAAAMGLLLRASAIVDFPWLNFRSMTHAHSHTAMMGWLYTAIFGLLLHLFLSEQERNRKRYKRLFIVLQTGVIGMMASFPFQGYGSVSISFATLHLFSSYWFLTLVWKNARTASIQATMLLRTAIVFMMTSTLGVYALGPVAVKIGRFTDAYHLCIQFFLHFQFQGWLLFSIAAIFWQWLKKRDIEMSNNQFRWFFGMLLLSTIGMFGLPLAEYAAFDLGISTNFLGAGLQLSATFLLLGFLQKIHPKLENIEGWKKACTQVVIGSLVVKSIGQLLLSCPEIALVPYEVRPFIVGFIHLLMLGIITGFIAFILLDLDVLKATRSATRFGLLTLGIGLLGTELLLFFQGASIWKGVAAWPFYNECILAFSIFLLLGTVSLFLSTLRIRTSIP
ncbi:MAG: hypothetical protein GC178_02885 [Flavobacteriales bacterium]|nr:hypothetical protein [Flavobacteriales bacterium]